MASSLRGSSARDATIYATGILSYEIEERGERIVFLAKTAESCSVRI